MLTTAAGAAAFAPGASVMPRAAGQGAVGLCMSAGSGKIKQVAAFRGAGAGRAGKSLVPTDPASIDLDLVYGTKVVKDTVGGVDTTYQKPASSFFSFGELAASVQMPMFHCSVARGLRATDVPSMLLVDFMVAIHRIAQARLVLFIKAASMRPRTLYVHKNSWMLTLARAHFFGQRRPPSALPPSPPPA